ncbi:MAG: acetyl-CoA carboxylase biotin carboxylase subunit, partial [Planctomycetes bacterium]|nr:acetyl-CoA carboxylase biotin carboxylase subunit [Planctomycetota bacterium]
LILPGGLGVRMDTHAYAGYTIPPTYDSMIGKLIVHRETRDDAIATMCRALDELVVGGVKTTVPLCREIFRHFHFIKGNLDTGFIEEYFVD